MPTIHRTIVRPIITEKGTFNTAVTGFSEYSAVTVLLRDEGGEVLGGLLGAIWGGWLSVSILWVSAPLRGRG